ncbi:hypothetical protein AMK59_3677 [Oryctes borbonicus]|uniref:Uncharacterized protein n=1 Tax=Oryctes borbonicus TaxID=1629725 RepID=A0A0T6B9G8_9SCAR|nr:hypothetical protein AMK59_3677 [Oryctes borbonicus]
MAAAAAAAVESNLAEMKRKLRTVKSAESLTSGISEVANNNEVDGLGPLQNLHKPPGHNRSVSHDSYFDTIQNSQNNSEGSLLDLSEIQLNFDLEESEMRIFSEDESLVSSPRIQKDGYRRYLARARPDDYHSAVGDSANPSPKKQARAALMSPESSMSRKRTRLEDQLSDIQYIDCNTPDNLVSTTAQIHHAPVATTALDSTTKSSAKSSAATAESSYQPPKSKSPRNSSSSSSNAEQTISSLDIGEKLLLLVQTGTLTTPTPPSPAYRPLNESSACTTPGDPSISPFGSESYFRTQLEKQRLVQDEDEGTKYRTDSAASIYENLVLPSPPSPKTSSPTYENVLTTISITYRSPTKRFSSSSTSPAANTAVDSIYEDISTNMERAAKVPTEPAVLPMQQANQPNTETVKESGERRPKSLSALEELRAKTESIRLKSNSSTGAVCNSRSETRTISSSSTLTNNGTLAKSSETATFDSSASSDLVNASSNASSLSPSSRQRPPGLPYHHFVVGNEDPLSPTDDLSLSEIVAQTCSENLSGEQYSCPATPTHASLSPNVSPTTNNSRTRNTESSDGSPVMMMMMVVVGSNTAPKVKLKSDASSSSVSVSSSERDDVEARATDSSEEELLARLSNCTANTTITNENECRMDKRKSSETVEDDDDNSIYQQVKYLRRSVHEINALLMDAGNDVCDDGGEKSEPAPSHDFDSLEEDRHLYQNVDESEREENSKETEKTERRSYHHHQHRRKEEQEVAATVTEEENVDACENVDVKSLTNIFEHKDNNTVTQSKSSLSCLPMSLHSIIAAPLSEERTLLSSSASMHARNSNSFTEKICNLVEEKSRQQTNPERNKKNLYDKDSLPPCVRLRNLRYANIIKTRSLDEHEFSKECGTEDLSSSTRRRTTATDVLTVTAADPSRRKSLDENLSSAVGYRRCYLPPIATNDPKVLNRPKQLPGSGGSDLTGRTTEGNEDRSGTHSHHRLNAQQPQQQCRQKGDERTLENAVATTGIITSARFGTSLSDDTKLNRERIERYKEERRRELHEKYRSESFKEDKGTLLSRLKPKSKDEEAVSVARRTSQQPNRASESNCTTYLRRARKKSDDSFEEEKDALNSELSADSLEMEIVDGASIVTTTMTTTVPISNRAEKQQRRNASGDDINLRSLAAKFERPAPAKNTKDHKGGGGAIADTLKQQQQSAGKKKKKTDDDEPTIADSNELLMDEILRAPFGRGGSGGRRRRTTSSGNEWKKENVARDGRNSDPKLGLEAKSPSSRSLETARKEKMSPSLCIKDMKAIFEPKSQQ